MKFHMCTLIILYGSFSWKDCIDCMCMHSTYLEQKVIARIYTTKVQQTIATN